MNKNVEKEFTKEEQKAIEEMKELVDEKDLELFKEYIRNNT